MSWSVSAVGKPAAVAAKLNDDFARMSPCVEPEETIRQSARSMISTALGSFRADQPVRVEASGSQNTIDNEPQYNQLKVSIEPIWGFVE